MKETNLTYSAKSYRWQVYMSLYEMSLEFLLLSPDYVYFIWLMVSNWLLIPSLSIQIIISSRESFNNSIIRKIFIHSSFFFSSEFSYCVLQKIFFFKWIFLLRFAEDFCLFKLSLFFPFFFSTYFWICWLFLVVFYFNPSFAFADESSFYCVFHLVVSHLLLEKFSKLGE